MWWEEGYEALWEPPVSPGDPGREYTCPATKQVKIRTSTPKENVVYLTADSDVELLELNPEDTYIIGGIVDKNRYKVGSPVDKGFPDSDSSTRHYARTKPALSLSEQHACQLGYT